MSIIDISIELREGMVAWPGSVGLTHEWVGRIDEGKASNDSVIKADVHLGTHVDAPLHFVDGALAVDKMSLDALCGPALVVEILGAKAIGFKELVAAAIPEGTERLLLKTDNSKVGYEGGFNKDFVALDESGARWIVERSIRLIGIDYLSIGPYPDGKAVHQVVLGAGVVVLEGLDLRGAGPGFYELFCLPLKIKGAEGSPARAVLRTIDEGESL